MTKQEIANELQSINRLLMGIEGHLRKYGVAASNLARLQEARVKVVALARQFEPKLEVK